MKLLKKIHIAYTGIIGELYKLCFRIGLLRVKGSGINNSIVRDKKIVVSLTSYGRRVNQFASIAIISLMKQSLKPDAIVLYLDNVNWNKDNLPKNIKNLIKKGLSVRFVDDLKSYKKLIPELISPIFSDDELIITIDDDQYYHKEMVKELVDAWNENPNMIHTHRAHKLSFDTQGQLKSYNNWFLEISDEKSRLLLPTGVGGCLYSPKLLHPDVTKIDLFFKLCPKADDVWFFFMEWLNGTMINTLPKKHRIMTPLDVFYQYIHKSASLAGSNYKDSGNDAQIRAVMNHYCIKDSDLRNG